MNNPHAIEIKGKTIEDVIKLLKESKNLAGEAEMNKFLQNQKLIPPEFNGKKVFFLKDIKLGKFDEFVPYMEKIKYGWYANLKNTKLEFEENDAVAFVEGTGILLLS